MNITFNDLKKKIKTKEIDTVLVCVSDMQGRLNGKRVTGKAFLDYIYKKHICVTIFIQLIWICLLYQDTNLLHGKLDMAT